MHVPCIRTMYQNHGDVLNTNAGETIPEKTGTKRTDLRKDENRTGKGQSWRDTVPLLIPRKTQLKGS